MGDKLNTAIATGALLASLAGPVGAETASKTAEIQDIKSDTQSKMQLLLKECDVDGNGAINGKEVMCKMKLNVRIKNEIIEEKNKNIIASEANIQASEANIQASEANIQASRESIKASRESIKASEEKTIELNKSIEETKKRIDELKKEIKAKLT